MAATFPGGVKVFTTKQAGDQIASAHINDLQAEVVAVETELRKTTGSVVSHGSLAGLSNNDHPQYLLSASTNYPRADGWIPVSDTWTYASATTITVPSGAASIYSVGDKFRLTANSVVLQGYIVKVENKKLTVVGNPLTNHTFTNISYSKTATPQGFPHWFSWTPTLNTGNAELQTCVTARFCIAGRTVTAMFGGSGSVTGSAGSIKISAPIYSSIQAFSLGFGYDGLSSMTNMIEESLGYFTVYKDTWYGNWQANETNTIIRFTSIYEI